MKIIKPSYEILTPINRTEILQQIELAARTCYKSEDKITEESGAKLIKRLIKLGHTAMIEHANFTVKFICDRGVSHEIVRHRIASYAQESTRYCNYGKDKFGNEITVIAPFWAEVGSPGYQEWEKAMAACEASYFALLDMGWTAQDARSVLPNSLKTEIIVTMNMRAWRNFFELRTPKEAHPQMREIAVPLLAELKEKLPELFGDLS